MNEREELEFLNQLIQKNTKELEKESKPKLTLIDGGKE